MLSKPGFQEGQHEGNTKYVDQNIIPGVVVNIELYQQHIHSVLFGSMFLPKKKTMMSPNTLRCPAHWPLRSLLDEARAHPPNSKRTAERTCVDGGESGGKMILTDGIDHLVILYGYLQRCWLGKSHLD